MNSALTATPPVSVIVSCFNQERYVARALDSIHAQNYSRLQLIIQDDASTDSSVPKIERWASAHADTKPMILPNQTNIGVCRSLNLALGLVTGDYVGFLAADDEWLPGKLADDISVLEQAPKSVGVVYSDAYLTDEEGNLLDATYMARYFPDCRSQPPSGRILERYLVRGNFVNPGTIVVRRECFERVGHFDESLLFEDFDFCLRLADQYDFTFTDYVGLRYRLSPNSFYATRAREIEAEKVAIYAKFATRRGQVGRIARRMMARTAWLEYKMANPAAGRLAIQAFRHSARLDAASVALLCKLGLPYDGRTVRTLRTMLSSVRRLGAGLRQVEQ